ncbi:MAG: 4'-phosphopantetheinyl transferase superfamily protein [Actinomycetota bacterium]|nr:4'-phosphopantetheinyl transferase superfamily protein [Actinomycetota bacterium]
MASRSAASPTVERDPGRPAVPAPRVEALFDLAVGAFELVGAGDPGTLLAEERSAVAGASLRRVSEFAGGRRCAHAALDHCGIAPAPLLPAPDRSPRWPPGVIGSIAHTADYAVAVAARGPGHVRPTGIGVDAERVDRMTPELVRTICTGRELDWLTRLPVERRAVAATAVFGAKEAFYKAQHPTTGSWVGFSEVTTRPFGAGLELSPVGGSPALALWRWPVSARWFDRDGIVVVGVTVHASGGEGS